MLNLKKLLKHYLPSPIRILLRRILTYSQRIGRWGIILVQMRGTTFSNQIKLLISAIASPIISLRQIDAWQNPQLLFDIDVRVFGIGQFSIRRFTDDLWHVLPWREHTVVDVIRRNLKQEDVFVDAGANIGFYSVLAAKLVGASGKVISIEMVPDTAKILRHNCEINNLNNINIIECALSDKSDQKTLAKVPIGNFGQASIGNTNINSKIYEIEVITSTLDDLLRDIKEIKMMKMDIEGTEITAIHGAKKILPKIKCIIYEQWNIITNNYSDEVSIVLINSGFSVSALDGRNLFANKQLKNE